MDIVQDFVALHGQRLLTQHLTRDAQREDVPCACALVIPVITLVSKVFVALVWARMLTPKAPYFSDAALTCCCSAPYYDRARDEPYL